jgi:succinoglycan biosynthesis protein ExoM
VDLIVVDNDGSDTSLVDSIKDAASRPEIGNVHFEVETVPGISAARNRVLSIAQLHNYEMLLLIDDDEWPSERWISEMIATKVATGAQVVGGPVTPVFAANSDKLRNVASFWTVGPQQRDGQPFVYATCNCLIQLEVLKDLKAPYFNPAYGLTGGEDTAFFYELHRRGVKMAWASEAVVLEDIPAERANMTWMRNRRYRIGISMAQVEMSEKGRLPTLVKSLALTGRLLIYPLLRREPASPWVGWWFETVKIAGRWAAHLGRQYYAYARTA